MHHTKKKKKFTSHIDITSNDNGGKLSTRFPKLIDFAKFSEGEKTIVLIKTIHVYIFKKRRKKYLGGKHCTQRKCILHNEYKETRVGTSPFEGRRNKGNYI